MKRNGRRAAALLLAFLLLTASAQAALEPSDRIEAAFGLLEEGNPFAARYGQITGQEITALFPLGVPYMFGGKNGMGLWRSYPDYGRWYCMQGSDYYRVGLQYFYGLDCTGFTQYVNQQCKLPKHGSLSDMMNTYAARDHHLYDQTPGKTPPDFAELKDTLQAGDLLLIRRAGARYRHIMMYIGTLRDYGYTEEQEPELAAYLDYPLVIHCGNSPVYGERFQQLIDSDPVRYSQTHTTDGGVQISIVGVAPEDAPVHGRVQQTDYDWFVMRDGGYVLTVVNMENLTSFCWYRQ